MKRVILIITVIFLLFSADNLYAQYSRSGAGESYLGLKLGIFAPNSDENGLKNYDTGGNFELSFGYKVNPNFALEGGVGYYAADHKNLKDVTVSAIPVTFTALGIVPLDNQFELYGGGGLGLYNCKLKSPEDDDTDTDSTLGFHLVGGADFNISRNVALGAELKWFKTKPEFSGEKVDFGGTVFNFGIKFKF